MMPSKDRDYASHSRRSQKPNVFIGEQLLAPREVSIDMNSVKLDSHMT